MSGAHRNLWDRSKDGNKREQRSFMRYAIVITLAFLVFLLVKKDSIVIWVNAGFTLRKQAHQIERLEKENAVLDDRIQALTNVKDSLETFAREQLLFSEPGDDVYIIGK